jgi:hypothetical protein
MVTSLPTPMNTVLSIIKTGVIFNSNQYFPFFIVVQDNNFYMLIIFLSRFSFFTVSLSVSGPDNKHPGFAVNLESNPVNFVKALLAHSNALRIGNDYGICCFRGNK